MSIQEQPACQNAPRTVEDIIRSIEEKTADGDYIFRGESQCHEKVSSNLYRKLEGTGLLELGVDTVEKEELRYARKYGYTPEADEFKILTEIQHFSGKTNLLDFTTDYRIALFFACNSFPFRDGRVILQNRNGKIKDWVIEPCNPDPKSRVRVQKSIFVRPPRGFIEPHSDDIVTILANLKQPMLDHLRKDHCISAEIIYPDLHGFVGSQDNRWSIYEDIGKGNDHLESGQEAKVREKKSKNYQKAVEHFTNAIDKAIQLDEGLAVAYDGRGRAYFSIGELDSPNDKLENAIEDFTEAIKYKSDYAPAYNNRGLAYFSKGNLENSKIDFDNAITDFSKAIELNSQFAEAHYNLGRTHFLRGEFTLAIRYYNTAIDLKSEKDIYYDRGVAWLHLQEWENAKSDLTCAKNLGVDIINLFRDLYKSLENCERLIGANLPLDVVLLLGGKQMSTPSQTLHENVPRTVLDLKDAIFYNNRGLNYKENREFDRAIKDFDKALELNTDFAEVYNNRGNVYRSTSDFSKAFEDYNMAIRLKPNFAEAYNNRGVAYGIKDQVDKAITDFDKAIGLSPAFADAYCNRGNAYLLTGDVDKAIEDYSRSIKHAPKDAMSYSNRGVAYLRKGEFDKTIEDASAAIALDEKLPNAYYNRAEAWLRLKEWDKARTDLATAKKLGMDVVAAFHNSYKNVETYAQWHRIQLPENIAHMLTQPRRVRFPQEKKIVSADGTPLESSNVLNLREQLRKTGTPLGTYLKVKPSFGLKTSPTEAFVVDRKTRDNLIAAHPSSVDILKPFLHGRDLRRWHAEPQEKWLIFAHRGIAINEYPAILKHLESHKDSLHKRSGKQEWYELPISLGKSHQFSQPKLVCPNLYNHQTFAVDTAGFYCGDTCYLIPTEELWLCGLLNSRVVEWFYSQESNQLTIDYLRARSGYMQQIPIPDITSTQKALIGKFVDYLIYFQQQPTINSRDLAYASDRVMLGYFERIIEGMIYESYLPDELHKSRKHLFQPLFDEKLPRLEEIQDDKMSACRDIFERLYEKTHPVAVNLFFLDSVKSVRIIEGKL